ncbi:predicted protein [Histoplasma capsulatum var. duboisii H88]|uniref:Predicted protein n=1 Tax=Ajellomyces capsulatus (strain H88) TaxID=544711 RepID=F0UE17_AJEC8|nr:predicted protein [Histoplasma capsulatum var. duboisii H88]
MASINCLLWMDLFGSVYDIGVMGLNGDYKEVFFGGININAPIDGEDNSHWLRPVIQHLNIQFAERMHRRGHKYYIEGNEADAPLNAEEEAPEQDVRRRLTRKKAIKWVVRILEQSHGREIRCC